MTRIFTVVLCLVVACGAVLAADPSALIRVERRAVDDLTTLRSAGQPVVMELNPCLLLEGGPENLKWLREHGYTTSILDADPWTSQYFVVGLRPDSDRAAVEAFGAVLLAEENWVLVRAPLDASLEPLAAAKVFVARVPRRPVAAPKAGPSLAPAGTPAADARTLAVPLVQQMVNSVSTTQIDQYWSDVTANPPTGTRLSTSQGCRDAATYCYNKYASYHVPAQYQNWNISHAPNVIGTHEGAINPANVFIVIGHLDDLPSSGLAPGADDNASATVDVLESARVLSCYAFRNTVKFINCTGEESGLLGSEAYADDAAVRGENILGVLNMDMISWQGDGSPNPENLDLNYNNASQDLGLRFAQAATTYGTGLAVDAFLCPSLNASDHYPFWTHGWKAVCGITDNEGYCGHGGNYPYYHTSNDTIANNGNKAFFYSVVKTSLATLAELAEPFKITFDRSAYSCTSSLQIILGDRDLDANPAAVETVVVTVSSTTEPTPEQVILTEKNADSMIFMGTIAATTGPPVHGDGLLSIAPGDTITSSYTDALDCNGAVQVPYTATAQADCTAPVITNVQAGDVLGTTATVTWTTTEASTSVVHYGTAPPGGSTKSSPALVTAHSVGLTGLAECTRYYYWVESLDAAGNVASNDNGGLYYSFETGKNTIPSFRSPDTPIPIPDNNPTGATSTINVPDDQTVLDVNVTVNITHTYDGDISLYLITPTGASVTLANSRGSGGDNFRNTVFDDEAATPIASGSAPFTGSFRPDSPLSAADGINAAGAWRLKVVDHASNNVGTIDDWTLTLTYPAAACGPHAGYSGHAAVLDSCLAGGAGHGDGVWDPGEDVQFSVAVANNGSVALTGVTATLTSTTPGVVLVGGVASYADIPPNTSGTSLAPHFTAHLPKTLPCNGAVDFQLTISSDQGTWPGAFSHFVGQITTPFGTPLNEAFSTGIPATWTVIDGGAGGNAAATWTTSNPGGRSIAAPMAAPTPIVDSDNAGAGASQDEQLLTPRLSLSSAATATLEFDEYFYWYNGGSDERGDVDVRSSLTSGAWVNVLRHQGASSANPAHKALDITPQAAGAADAQVRFHYYNGAYEWYWQVDNVKVSYTATPGCNMTVCAASGPPPVPDGRFGSAMRATRGAIGGEAIDVQWDVVTCTGADYHLLYGPLAGVSSYTLAGAACDLGPTGVYHWSSVPPGDLWYVVAADDNGVTEGSWGTDSSGAHRGGDTPSGRCAVTARDNTGTCP